MIAHERPDGVLLWMRVAASGVERVTHLRHAESTRNGLASVEIQRDALDVHFVRVGNVLDQTDDSVDIVAFRTASGSRRVTPL